MLKNKGYNMKTKKAEKHLEPWTLEESKQFLNLYLDGVKMRDVSIVCDQIATTLKRTYDAIKLRKQEVLSILTEGEQGLRPEKWTPHMIQAIKEVMEERSITRTRMTMWFE